MRTVTRALLLVLAASAACSRAPQQPAAATPTGPTAAAGSQTAIAFVGGVSGPMDVAFPSRADSFLFRQDLEPKYQSMGRGVTQTYVDREGEAVWLQEYIRYSVNGCD